MEFLCYTTPAYLPEMIRKSWFLGEKSTKKRKTSRSTPNTGVFDIPLMFPNAGASFGGVDPEEERNAPPEATPVTFPVCKHAEGHAWTQDDPPPNFQSLFARIVKPNDISEQHVQALNIQTLPTCSVNGLVPNAPDGTSYHEPPIPTSTPNSGRAESETTRKRKDFDEKLAELRVDNDLAFRTLSKRMAVGVKPPRIAHMRKFYLGLESMSQYWDCTLDQYYDASIADSGVDGEQAVKRQKLENGFSPRGSPVEQSAPTLEEPLQVTWSNASKSTSEVWKSQIERLTTEPKDNEDTTDLPPPPGSPLSATPEPQTRRRYKGRRTSTGREMPDSFRTDTVKALVDAASWAFGANVSAPKAALQFNKLNLPVRQTGTVYRMPQDRMKYRMGWREGPIMRLQTRAETEFLDENGEQREHMARLDSLREIAALLQLAQERRREGRVEIKPGEGQWWTTKPRWGGAPGGEAQNETGNTDVQQFADAILNASRVQDGKLFLPTNVSAQGQKRKTPAMLWKELKVGSGNWTPKVDYYAIGKDSRSEWDDVRLDDLLDMPTLTVYQVFLVSSLNHHISILKMSVHGAYVDYLTSATMPQPHPEDAEWSVPKLQRTKWFDLFDVEQRVEVFRGLWGVMAYLTRDMKQDTKTS